MTIMAKGTKKRPQNDTAPRVGVAGVFGDVCPDVGLAKGRIDRLRALRVCDTDSIGTGRGASAKGAPGGKDGLGRCLRCFGIPVVFVAEGVAGAVVKVTIEWLVTVEL